MKPVGGCTADMIVQVIKDMLTQMNLKLENARGQCYDGAVVMADEKSGVAVQIKSLNSKCLYTHCYGHALNVSIKDARTEVKCLKDTFDTANKVCKLVNKSPQRKTDLRKFRLESGNEEKRFPLPFAQHDGQCVGPLSLPSFPIIMS